MTNPLNELPAQYRLSPIRRMLQGEDRKRYDAIILEMSKIENTDDPCYVKLQAEIQNLIAKTPLGKFKSVTIIA